MKNCGVLAADKLLSSCRKFAALLCALVCALSVCACGDNESGGSSPQAGKEVTLIIECESNLIFSKYDLNVYVDDKLQGSLDHGDTQEFSVALDEGTHTLRVANKDDDGVDGNIELPVSEDRSTYKFKVKCTNSQVEIEAIDSLKPPMSSDDATDMSHDEVRQAFKDAGFANVREEEERTLSLDERSRNGMVASISVAGNEDFDADDSFNADDEVVITYQLLADLKVPASASDLEGRNYQDVERMFKDAGFTNVTTSEAGSDKVEGAVTEVTIGGLFGESNFSSGDTFAFDDEVGIEYSDGSTKTKVEDSGNAEPVPEEDLNKLLSQTSGDASWFSAKYRGRTITFDGWVGSLQHHEDYNTRWDVLILKGDNGDASSDLSFRLTNVAMYQMNVTNSDSLREGDNITITAIVGDYDAAAGWLELDPVSISIR